MIRLNSFKSHDEKNLGLKKIIDVPVGAKNIRVEESQPTKSRIVVRSKKSKNILIDGLINLAALFLICSC